MLHSGVLKKFGLYGLIRIALPLLPQGAQVEWVQNALLLMLLGNILVMGLVTIHANRLDDTLANSSVMHMGYIFLGLAAGTEIALKGAVLLMFAHGVSIALLFGLCGRMRNQLGTLEYNKLGGLASHAPAFTVSVRLWSLRQHRPARSRQLRGRGDGLRGQLHRVQGR
jgi:NADH-quinone oxidoreductase subunit M